MRLDEVGVVSMVKGEKVQTHRTKFGTAIGNDTRIGIHVSINPGVKVGAGTFISSQSLITQDISDGQFAVMKQGELVTRENTAKASTPDDREQFKKKV